MLDGHTISVIGALIASSASVYGAWSGYVKRSYWADFFSDRRTLVDSLRREKQDAADNLRRALAAEALSNTYERSLDEMRREISSFETRLNALEPFKQRVDLLADWIVDQIIPYAMFLEELVRENKLDFKGRSMPKLPPDVIRDRFGLTEQFDAP